MMIIGNINKISQKYTAYLKDFDNIPHHKQQSLYEISKTFSKEETQKKVKKNLNTTATGYLW